MLTPTITSKTRELQNMSFLDNVVFSDGLFSRSSFGIMPPPRYEGIRKIAISSADAIAAIDYIKSSVAI